MLLKDETYTEVQAEDLTQLDKFEMKRALHIKPTVSRQELDAISEQLGPDKQLRTKLYEQEHEDPLREFWNHKYRLARVIGIILASEHIISISHYDPPDTPRDLAINKLTYVLVVANLLIFIVSYHPKVSIKASYVGWLVLSVVSLLGLLRMQNRVEFQAKSFEAIMSFMNQCFGIFIGILIINTHFCDIRFNAVVVVVLYALFSLGAYQGFHLMAQIFEVQVRFQTRYVHGFVLISVMQVYYRWQVMEQASEFKDKINEQKKFKRIFDTLKEPVIISQGDHPFYINDMFLQRFQSPIRQFIEEDAGLNQQPPLTSQATLISNLVESVNEIKETLQGYFRPDTRKLKASFTSCKMLFLFKDNSQAEPND